jgi:hypothetical protein
MHRPVGELLALWAYEFGPSAISLEDVVSRASAELRGLLLKVACDLCDRRVVSLQRLEARASAVEGRCFGVWRLMRGAGAYGALSGLRLRLGCFWRLFVCFIFARPSSPRCHSG